MMIAAARFVTLVVASSAVLRPAPAQAQPDAPSAPDSLVEAVVYTTLRPPNWDIYLFEEPSSSPRRLTDDPALDYNAVFSPDGRWVVFTSERTGSADLYTLDVEAREAGSAPVRLTYHHAMDDAATFSPDGSQLAFVSTRDGSADIFVMPFSPGDTTAETHAVNLTRRPGGDFNPAFSPDGRRIAFSRQEYLWRSQGHDEMADIGLYIMDADGSNVRRLSKLGVGLPGGAGARGPQASGAPAWSRDGAAVYYYHTYLRVLEEGDPPALEEGLEIRRIAPDGSDDTVVAHDGFTPAVRSDGRIGFVRPAPDRPGRNLVSGDVLSVAPDGSDPRVESGTLESCFAPDFDRHSERMLCHGPGLENAAVLVSTENRGGAFGPPDAVRQVRLPDRTLAVHGVRGGFPALTPNGEVISTLRGISAVATRAGETQKMTVPLHVSAVDGGGLRELFTPPSGVSWGAAVAREAGWGVVAVGPPFAEGSARVDIWKFRVDGSDAVNLTRDSAANNAFPHVSSDGRRIVFRSTRDGLRGLDGARAFSDPVDRAIYIMDGDGGDPHRLTSTVTRETMPALSPDGDYVVFVIRGANGAKLWLRSVDGSENRLLEPDRAHIPDLSMHPRFSPDGMWVVFTSDRGGFNDEWPVYDGGPQPYGDLWAVPVAGGPAVRLTDNKWEDGPNDWGYVRLPRNQP